jgi:hypothetical protein
MRACPARMGLLSDGTGLPRRYRHAQKRKEPSFRRYFTLRSDTQARTHKFVQVLNATDPDLENLHERRGDVLQYHGWKSAAISGLNTIDYYRSVVTGDPARPRSSEAGFQRIATAWVCVPFCSYARPSPS